MAHDDLFTGLLTAGLPLSQKGQGKILASFSVLLSMDCRQLNLILIRRSGHPAVRMTPFLAEEKIIRHVAVAVMVQITVADGDGDYQTGQAEERYLTIAGVEDGEILVDRVEGDALWIGGEKGRYRIWPEEFPHG